MATLDADVDKAPPYFEASQTLNGGDHMDITPGEQGLDALKVDNIVHGADCDVVIRVDSTGDGIYNREVTIDSLSGTGISQGNGVLLGADSMVLRITDTSGGSNNDFIVTGELLR